MSRLDDLPPDQRAALSLLLLQGKNYAEVARLLHIGERAVHDRAHAALAVLAPREAAQLPSSRLGGAILLAVIAAVIVVVVLLATGGGGGHRRSSTATGARASSTTPRASETKRITLTPPNPSSRALGVAAVLQ